MDGYIFTLPSNRTGKLRWVIDDPSITFWSFSIHLSIFLSISGSGFFFLEVIFFLFTSHWMIFFCFITINISIFGLNCLILERIKNKQIQWEIRDMHLYVRKIWKFSYWKCSIFIKFANESVFFRIRAYILWWVERTRSRWPTWLGEILSSSEGWSNQLSWISTPCWGKYSISIELYGIIMLESW